jgi:hypothetical protein
VVAVLGSAFFAFSLSGSTRGVYLPGPTSAGHHQIESECKVCHSSAFSDREAIQAACVRCHGAELREAEDSHPERKFTDPRNAGRVEVLDARYCVTCHREHRPEQTSAMGLSIPADYCYRCHESIADERPTHRGLAFDTCASAGCHNFHDNRALYADFLLRHADGPKTLPTPRRLELTGSAPASAPVSRTEADGPRGFALPNDELSAWEKSGPARGGVNCSGCHASGRGGELERRVSDARCGECHEAERAGFERGRHGMRAAAKLAPLRVDEARLPMDARASHGTVGCTSCHGSHGFDTRRAAAEACLGCHADEHSRAYPSSPHGEAWLGGANGKASVSCAGCHMPRLEQDGVVRAVHAQNDNLRPNEKMAREVCLSCHGLAFTLDALADTELVRGNFNGAPRRHVRSIEMARQHAGR